MKPKTETPAAKSSPGPLQLTTLPVDKLLFGQDHPMGAMNARLTDRGEDIEALTSSILADGILQPLLVWKDAGKYYVVDGSRRLTAINAIHANALTKLDTAKRFENIPAMLFEGGDIDTAIGMSLAANILQLPLHEVDQYEAFSALPKDWSREQIRDRFGLDSVAVVDRILALGKLAEPIRKAWRAGDIDGDAAKAYTLEPDLERQAALFKKLGKNQANNRYKVRTAIVGENENTNLLLFVGAEAFTAAGGHLVSDLFAGDSGTPIASIADRALLKKLADEKVEAKIADILAAGWSWASVEVDLPNNWSWTWKKHGLAAKSATEAQKKSTGAVVKVDHQGKFAIEYGVQKPGAKMPKAASKGAGAGKADQPKAEPKIPHEMEMTLMRQATTATAAALALQPGLAIAALLAGLAANGNGPVRATYQGLDREDTAGDDGEDFGKVLDVQLAKGKATALELAKVACTALDLTIANDPNPFQDRDAAALVKHIDADALNKALRAGWDAMAYFEGTSKAFSQRAIEEAIGAEAWAGIATASKAEIAEFAWVNVPKTGWLPPELRAPGYNGPAGKAKKKGGR